MFDYDGWIDDLDARFDDAAYFQFNMEGFHTAAKYEYDRGSDHDAIREILGALFHAWNFAYELVPWFPKVNGLWRLRGLAAGIRDDFEEVSAYELTAEKIIEAWAMDNFKAARPTIAFIDRMRQLIWNEPFHVAWAARPEGPG